MDSFKKFQTQKQKFLDKKIWGSQFSPRLYIWFAIWIILFGGLSMYVAYRFAPQYGWHTNGWLPFLMFIPGAIFGLGVGGFITLFDYFIRKARSNVHTNNWVMNKVKHKFFTHHLITVSIGLFVGIVGATILTMFSKGEDKFSTIIFLVMIPAGIALGLGVTGVVKDCTEEVQETLSKEDVEAEVKAVNQLNKEDNQNPLDK